MEKQDSGDINDFSTEPCSVTITVNKFSNIIPNDFGDNQNLQNDASSSSNNLGDFMLSEKTNVDDIFNEADVNQLSEFYAGDSVDNLPSDAQMFQVNKKISKVLDDSGSFDAINDAQVLKHRLRTLEIEKLALMVDHNNLIREFNKSVESHLEEIRNLNELNENYDHEIQELRDLTCFLDDDRKKYKKMAKEWQKFGRHMLTVVKSEVSDYQDKMTALENKQKSLIAENVELRNLCVHLDRQRSTNSTETDNKSNIKLIVCSECSALETPKGAGKWKGSNKSKHSASVGGVGSQKNLVTHDVLVNTVKEHDELNKTYRIDNRNEKKKVKFDFPDDSDTSTASDLDALEFPPRIAEFEKNSKLIRGFSNLSLSEGETTPVNLDRMPSKSNVLKKFDEENLSSDHLFFPTTPKKSTTKSTNSPIEDGDVNRMNELKSEFNDSNIVTIPISLNNISPTYLQNVCDKKQEIIGNSFLSIFNEDPFDHVTINTEYI